MTDVFFAFFNKNITFVIHFILNVLQINFFVMKAIKHWVALLCMGVILFTSCEKPIATSQLGAIPADAMFVVSI